jgi:outer membrane protein assembly factor BamA
VLIRLCLAACLLALLTSAYAQTTVDSSARPAQEIKLTRIVFENATLLSPEEQNQISEKLHENDSYGQPSVDPSGVAEEAAERVREAYQDKGHFNPDVEFKVNQVSAEPPGSQIEVVVRVVEPGQQYRLSRLHWKSMTLFSEQQLLDLMPIHPGEIFSRAKIAEGLENARKLYQSRGYINMTQIPKTVVDEAEGTIALDIDVDEGGKFTLRSVGFSGLTTGQLQEAFASVKPFYGQPYNPALYNNIYQRLDPILPECALNSGYQVHLDEYTHLVDVFFDFEECTDQWFQSQIQPN